MIVRKLADYDALSLEAALIVARQIRTTPGTVLGLAAGKTPIGTYRELVRMHREEGLDFSRTVFFSLDEFQGLTPDHPQSFASFLHQHFLDHINTSKSNVHLLSGSATETDCEQYEGAIQDAGGIDLQILGIGLNGHIAFNEPGSSFDSRTRVVTLSHETAPGTPGTAVTMGIGTILLARHILLLAYGPDKAQVVDAALHGPQTESLPASALQRHPNLTVLVTS